MIDSLAAQLAMRNRAIAVVVASTGSVTLAATGQGYTRTAGSFLDDGFLVGMEISASGFASNPTDVIIAVSALSITTRNARAAEAAGAGRTLACGLPGLRAWENADFTPVALRPYVEDEWVPGTSRLLSYPASAGTVEETGLYVMRWYGLANTGIGATRRSIDALKALFAPGTTFDVAGDSLRVRSDVGPTAGQLQPLDGGWASVTLRIPWRAFSQNAVAA